VRRQTFQVAAVEKFRKAKRRETEMRPTGSNSFVKGLCSRGGKHVTRIVFAFLTTLAVANFSLAEETTFKVKLADAKGKQAEANMILSDNNKNIVVRVADRDAVTIPYDQIDKFSYEYTKKHRITQGAIVMVASLGVGAIVMLTKSKSHWLYIDFHEQTTPKSVVLRMDKNDYKNICASLKTHTGKEVQFLEPEKEKKDKDKNKEKDKDKNKEQPKDKP
jgi:hypothetical protein